MSEQFEETLWYALTLQAEVVKQPSGKAGRYGPPNFIEKNKQGPGTYTVAVITRDQPETTRNPTFCQTSSVFHGPGFGVNNKYRYVDGTILTVRPLGPNRDFCEVATISPFSGPDITSGMGAQGIPQTIPTPTKKV